jgi:hypothetical protein
MKGVRDDAEPLRVRKADHVKAGNPVLIEKLHIAFQV